MSVIARAPSRSIHLRSLFMIRGLLVGDARDAHPQGQRRAHALIPDSWESDATHVPHDRLITQLEFERGYEHREYDFY